MVDRSALQSELDRILVRVGGKYPVGGAPFRVEIHPGCFPADEVQDALTSVGTAGASARYVVGLAPRIRVNIRPDRPEVKADLERRFGPLVDVVLGDVVPA